jgi:hypothetical protein
MLQSVPAVDLASHTIARAGTHLVRWVDYQAPAGVHLCECPATRTVYAASERSPSSLDPSRQEGGLKP